MKKTILWMTCIICVLGFSACSNELEPEVEKAMSEAEAIQKAPRSVKANKGCSMYCINISEYWGHYYVPDQRPEIVKSILEVGNTVVAVFLSDKTPSPNIGPYEIGFYPYVDNGWRLYLDGSSHDIMYITHMQENDSHSGYGIDIPILGSDLLYASMLFSDTDYHFECRFPALSQSLSNYSLYVFIGRYHEPGTDHFHGQWMSFPLPIKGPATYFENFNHVDNPWFYPHWDLMRS